MPVPQSRKSLSHKLKEVKRLTRVTEPLWRGPELDGITQSMLQRYLICPERCRVAWIEGLGAAERFTPEIEYGNMWHECEEHHAAGDNWEGALLAYCLRLRQKYPQQSADIDKWYRVCRVEFPLYVKYWSRNRHQVKRRPIYQEFEFFEPILLPSGRSVRLSGKWDSVDEVDGELWLQENKTKSTVNIQNITGMLQFDIQTMTYLFALKHHFPGKSLRGIRYNLIQRPLSGGKGSIRQRKQTKTQHAETKEAFFLRLKSVIEAEPDQFFQRLQVEVSDQDIEKFARQTLVPCLENVSDDYEWWSYCLRKRMDVFDFVRREKYFPKHRKRHVRMPYGVYTRNIEQYSSLIDIYLNTGSTVGMVRSERLFPELNLSPEEKLEIYAKRNKAVART